MSFRCKLAEAIKRRQNTLCLGIDPHLDSAPAFLAPRVAKLGWQKAIEGWAFGLLEISQGRIPAVKLQSAFFEAQGPEGIRLLQKLIKQAAAYGLLTILDAKRGDIASTMQAYGVFAFATMGADALTVQPYMGYDVVAPLSPWLAKEHGVYLVWLSSNPGGRLLQAQRAPDGRLLIAHLLEHFVERMEGAGTIGALGLVAGATRLSELSDELVDELKAYPLLMPGLGEQKAVLTGKLAALINSSVAPLLPISRGLTGLGSQADSPLRTARTLNEYLLGYHQVLSVSIDQWRIPTASFMPGRSPEGVSSHEI